MRDHMLNHGLELPLIGTDTGYFQVVFPGPADNLERIRAPQSQLTITPAVEAQLNERQRKMAQWLAEGNELTSRQCEAEFKTTRDTTSRDFDLLLSLGLAKKEGKRKWGQF